MGKISYISSFNKLPGAFLIALSVIIFLYLIELSLPINFFTFRLWEALEVDKLLPGPFYPKTKISMIEVGNLGHHSEYAVNKKVEWETDHYGFRKRDREITRYGIVILGDSAIGGSSLTQNDMLSEVLEKRLKISIYPFTLGGDDIVNNFAGAKRFTENPPDTVILAKTERSIPSLLPLKPQDDSKQSHSWLNQRSGLFLDNHQRIAVLLIRIDKNIAANYFESSIKRAVRRLTKNGSLPFVAVQSDVNKRMLFFRNTVERMADNKVIQPEEIEKIAQVIASYARIFKERGLRFIFLPVPDKENIYYKYVPIKNRAKPRFLEKLISKLQKEGVEVIDIQKAFDEASGQNNILIYHTDDTHWNAYGVKIAADLTYKVLEEGESHPRN